MTHKIDILMAVHNGGTFLSEQLDSLMRQGEDWRLIVRDDGSMDGSAGVVQQFLGWHPERVEYSRNDINLGVVSTFNFLLTKSAADYIMLCDQDDVWLPQKIQTTFDKMKEMENRFGEKTPLLVHTDAKVGTEDLEIISGSLWRYQVTDPVRGRKLRRLLLQNIATGCTVMINRPLLEIALPVPEDAMMHDWWLALVASTFGQIDHVSEPTMIYRQHGQNETGAKEWSPAVAAKRLLNIFRGRPVIDRDEEVHRRILRQAAAFLERYGDKMTAADRQTVRIFIDLEHKNFVMRRYCIVKYGLWYSGLTRNIARLVLG